MNPPPEPRAATPPQEAPSPGVSVLLSTCPQTEAERLATFLVEGGHAACVNILPQVTSIYRWKGKVERDQESLLVIKCPRANLDQLLTALRSQHPYEVPEILSLEVTGGNPAYLSWVLECAGGG